MKGGDYKTNGNIIWIKYEAVHPTVVSENYFSLGILTILIKAQIVSILRNIFAGKFTYTNGQKKGYKIV